MTIHISKDLIDEIFAQDLAADPSTSPTINDHPLRHRTLVLSAISCEGGAVTEDEFTISVEPDIIDCADAVLTGPSVTLASTPYELLLIEANEIGFDVATVDVEHAECGIVYTLQDDAGGAIDPALYDVDPTSGLITITVSDGSDFANYTPTEPLALVLKATVSGQPIEAFSAPFTVYFTHPCASTEIDLVERSKPIPTLETSVLRGTPETFQFEVSDSTSTEYASRGLGTQICGDFSYAVLEPADLDQDHTKLSDVTERTIEVLTDNPADRGSHAMILRVTLEDYDISQDFEFDVEILACVLESISFQGTIPSPTPYSIDAPLAIPLPDILLTPSCSDEYEITVSGVPTLPSAMIEVDEVNHKLDVFSEDANLDGESFIVTVTLSSGGLTDEVEFEMVVGSVNECIGDELTVISGPEATSDYYINFGGGGGSGSADYVLEVS